MDAVGIGYGECFIDTALAAYNLNPSQAEYPVSKLATSFLGVSVEDTDALGCAQAIWNLKPVLEEELEKNGMTALYRDNKRA